MLTPDIMMAAGGGALTLAILDKVFSFIRSQHSRTTSSNGTQHEITRNIHDALKDIAAANYQQTEVMRDQAKAMQTQADALDRISRYWSNPPVTGGR